ncbi:MAG: hypothetical protein MUC50_23455 [Myxococcota bacterium]|nr:hypothetical protein [Myxococcota bacterium]
MIGKKKEMTCVLALLLAVAVTGCPVDDETPLGPICKGDFYVWDASGLEDIGQCVEIEGSLKISIYDKWGPADLGGLSNLSVVRGTLDIERNWTLERLDGLSGLTRVGRLRIVDNPALRQIDGLSNLRQCKGMVWIEDNAVLGGLDGLRNLSEAYSVTIHGNRSLNSLDGFTNLARLEGDLDIQNNLDLETVDGFSGLKEVHSLIIAGNPRLEGLAGLAKLARIHTLLMLGYCNEEFCRGNGELVDLDDLAGLRVIAFGISIAGNKKLASLEGLMSLERVGGSNIDILDNPALSNVEIQAFIESAKNAGFDGTVNLSRSGASE